MGDNHSAEIKSTSEIGLAKVSKILVLFAAVFIFYLVWFTVITYREQLVNSKTYERLVVISLKHLSSISSSQARLIAKVSLGFVTVMVVFHRQRKASMT
jgi:hypothetical protein